MARIIPVPFVIGVGGGSGAGKTFFIDRVLEKTGKKQIARIEHDWYYHHRPGLSLEARRLQNYDHPDALETELLVLQIKDLLKGRPIQAPQYDYTRHLRKEKPCQILPVKVILLDGILIFHDQALRELIHLKVFLDTESDLRFERRMARDVHERGRTKMSVTRQYRKTVKPMHDRFVAPTRAYADMVVPACGMEDAVMDVAGLINAAREGEGLKPMPLSFTGNVFQPVLIKLPGYSTTKAMLWQYRKRIIFGRLC